MGTVSVTGQRTCLRCGEELTRGFRGDICKTCQNIEPKRDDLDVELEDAMREYGSLATRPIEHILEDLSCDELSSIASFKRSKAGDVKPGNVRLTPEEEATIREGIDSLPRRVKPERPREPKTALQGGTSVDGLKLTPVSMLPGRARGGYGAEIVDAFLRGGADICKVEYGKVNPNSLQTLLTGVIRNAKLGHRCYATSRQGACYLVKVRSEEPPKKGK